MAIINSVGDDALQVLCLGQQQWVCHTCFRKLEQLLEHVLHTGKHQAECARDRRRKWAHGCNVAKTGDGAVCVHKRGGEDEIYEATKHQEWRIGVQAWAVLCERRFRDRGADAHELAHITAPVEVTVRKEHRANSEVSNYENNKS